MGLFGPKKKSYIGVDLGVGGIKLVELQNEKGRARLITYGFTERLPDAEPSALVDAPRDTADLLKKVLQKAKVTTTQAVTGLPVAAVFSSVITIPKGSEKDQKDAIQWQAKKLIPVPLEEMMLDSKVIASTRPAQPAPDKKDETKTVQVLITGASKTMVQKYVDVFKMSGLNLSYLETEVFGLIRSLVGKDRATTMIVDMGTARTNIIIVENGIPFVTRSIDMGGATLTKAMSRALNMDLKSAEQMKCDIKSVTSIYPDEGIPKIFESALLPMLTELHYSINLYTGQSEGGPASKAIEKIILTGGSSVLPGLSAYFSSQLNIRTYLGDPWARVVYSDELKPIIDEIGPRFAVAIGLAMREIE